MDSDVKKVAYYKHQRIPEIKDLIKDKGCDLESYAGKDFNPKPLKRSWYHNTFTPGKSRITSDYYISDHILEKNLKVNPRISFLQNEITNKEYKIKSYKREKTKDKHLKLIEEMKEEIKELPPYVINDIIPSQKKKLNSRGYQGKEGDTTIEYKNICSHINHYQGLKKKNKTTNYDKIIDALEEELLNTTKIIHKDYNESELKTRKIKIYPTKDQKEKLNQWIGDSRLTYNTIMSYLLEQPKEKVNDFDIRDKFVTIQDNDIDVLKESFKRTPKDIRSPEAFIAAQNYNTELKKGLTKLNPQYESLRRAIFYKKQEPNPDLILIEELEQKLLTLPKHIPYNPNLSLRSKKDVTQFIRIDSQAFRCNGSKSFTIFPRMNIDPIRTKEKIIKIDNQCMIKKDQTGWYILIPERYQPKENIEKSNRIIALDPGIRTAFTGIDLEGNIIELGKNWFEDMKNSISKKDSWKSKRDVIDNMEGKSNREKKLLKHRLQKANAIYLRSEKKLVNRIDYFHKKTANILLKGYDFVILPKLRSQKILFKDANIYNKSVLMISHCKFHDYISWKAEKEGKVLIKADEYLTSKTCFRCGCYNNMKGSKDYHCDGCGFNADRDVNAAANILTKNLRLVAASLQDST